MNRPLEAEPELGHQPVYLRRQPKYFGEQLLLQPPPATEEEDDARVMERWRWQRAEARRLGVSGDVQSGAVAMAQYFGSRLQLTPHLHVLVPEVVWDEAGQPLPLPAPDEAAVETVLRRTVRQLAERWPSDAVPWDEDEYRQLQHAAVQERLALDVAPRQRRRPVAMVEGFSLHAGTWVHGNDRQGLERLVRYSMDRVALPIEERSPGRWVGQGRGRRSAPSMSSSA